MEEKSEMLQLRNLASVLIERAAAMAKMGKSFGTVRDLYEALGYTKTPTFDDYYAKYSRQDIAKRIVSAPVSATWRKFPILVENDAEETELEKEWNSFVVKYNIYHYLSRIDKLSGIGSYGVLLMGFDDGGDLSKPVMGSNRKLLYVRPYTESNADIETYEEDTKNERFGLPLTYKISVSSTKTSSKINRQLSVHYSRVLHIAEDLEENDIYGTPRLKCVLNRLNDIELISGGGAEMFWRGAFPGYGFMLDKEANVTAQTLSALETEIEEYIHGLRRYIRAQGMTIENLAQQVASPEGHFKVIVSLISGATEIPQRILLGSERGELASSQDETNWNNKIAERRENYVTPMILYPFVNRLISLGVLPEAKNDFIFEWEDLFAPSEKERADTSKVKTEAIASYVNAIGADRLIPPKFFLRNFIDLTEDEIEQIEDERGTMEVEDINDLDVDDDIDSDSSEV
jgi:hypothetical protein